MSEPILDERPGGICGIACAFDILADRLHENASAGANPKVDNVHPQQGECGCRILVPAWSIERAGGRKCHPGRDTRDAHAHLNVSQRDFGIFAHEIAAILNHVGEPEKERKAFMDSIESRRSMVGAGPARRHQP